jgi:hypothetical protein
MMRALDSILILGRNENHNVTNPENKEPAEAQECIFARNLQTRARRHVEARRIQYPQFPFELASPSFSDGPRLQ